MPTVVVRAPVLSGVVIAAVGVAVVPVAFAAALAVVPEPFAAALVVVPVAFAAVLSCSLTLKTHESSSFCSNFGRRVLGCIDAGLLMNFCLVLKLVI